MDKVIEALYDKLAEERFDEFMESYREDKEMAFQGYQRLKKQLSAELAGELELVMDRQLELMEAELRESFSEGFRLGVKMMCEVFKKEGVTA